MIKARMMKLRGYIPDKDEIMEYLNKPIVDSEGQERVSHVMVMWCDLFSVVIKTQVIKPTCKLITRGLYNYKLNNQFLF